MIRTEALRHAKRYVKDTLAAQRRLGYSSEVSEESYARAVQETAAAFESLLRLARRHEKRAA